MSDDMLDAAAQAELLIRAFGEVWIKYTTDKAGNIVTEFVDPYEVVKDEKTPN